MINKKNLRNLILNDINDYLILFEDTANIESFETEYSNEYRFFSNEALKFINDNFAKCKKKNKDLKDYVIYGLRSFETYGGKIFISFEKGDYKTYLACKESGYKKFIEEKNFFILPLSVASVITTKDNKILTLDYLDGFKLPGGIIIEEDVDGDNIDLLNCINRNLKQDSINIDLYDSKIIGIYKSKNSCIIILNQKTNISSKDINANFINNNITTLGNIILSDKYFKRVRQAFKFHLKENFTNYDYINVRLK